MGASHLNVLLNHPRWEVAWACDLSPQRLEWAATLSPTLRVTDNIDDILNDPTVETVAILTLADIRPALMRRALKAGKHIFAEKPIAGSVAEEWALLEEIESSDRLVGVNIFNRVAWYHDAIHEFIARGEIGETAIVRVWHQTAGMMPGSGTHGPEGPPFHDCGMHYVDVARWYAGSEYDRWHAQGLRMWDWPEPWWVTVHGNFQNGVVFQITNGFVFGQLAKDIIKSSGVEITGTHGVARLTLDHDGAKLELHGVTTTEHKVAPSGGKNLPTAYERLAQSLDAGRNVGLPQARDSVIASDISQQMLDAATQDNPPSIGSPDDISRIHAHKSAAAAVRAEAVRAEAVRAEAAKVTVQVKP
jgi:myo-inositol 2-dehydrogenase/D-chiro-inositol 1-dehydrogenase